MIAIFIIYFVRPVLLFLLAVYCPECGLVLDRDLNASLNIEALGLESLGYALEAPRL